MKKSFSLLVAAAGLCVTLVTASAQSSSVHPLMPSIFDFSFSVPLSLAVTNSKDMQGNTVVTNSVDTVDITERAHFNSSDSGYHQSLTANSISLSTESGGQTWSLSIVLDTTRGVAQVAYSDINGAPAATTSWSDIEVNFRDMLYHLSNGVIILMPGSSDSLRTQISGSYIRRNYTDTLDHTERSIPLTLAPGVISVTTTGSLPSGVKQVNAQSRELSAFLSSDGSTVIVRAERSCEIVSIGGLVLWRSENSSTHEYRVPVSQIGAGAVIVHSGDSLVKLFLP